jgi:hypothetical protein
MRLDGHLLGVTLAVMTLLGGTRQAAGQGLPSEPISVAGGRLVISGETTASAAPKDTGYFNASDYGQNGLRHLSLGVTTGLSLGDHVSLLGEIRAENGQRADGRSTGAGRRGRHHGQSLEPTRARRQ